MRLIECHACYRVWNDKDATGVCPSCGTENGVDDEDAANQEHLRKLTW